MNAASNRKPDFSRALHRTPAETAPKSEAKPETGAAAATTTESQSETVPAPRLKAPRVKPVRITVDLAPDLHNQLKIWAATEGVKLSDVVRALASELLSDEQLAERVRRTIEDA